MITTLLDSLGKWRKRCRACDRGGIHKSEMQSFQNLQASARFKTVIEFHCVQCGTLWLHPDHSDFLVRVFKNELYAQWKQRWWIPTASQIAVLNLIGGTSADDERSISFPCEVRLPNGSRVERALLTTTNGRYCFGQFPKSKNVAVLSEDYELSPSRHALPVAVRAVAMNAPEKRMGYAPVNVQDTKGHRYTLYGPMDFFEKGEVLGPEILLDDSPYHGKNVVFPGRVEMHLICDNFDEETKRRSASAP
jgi:hypothetical protein